MDLPQLIAALESYPALAVRVSELLQSAPKRAANAAHAELMASPEHQARIERDRRERTIEALRTRLSGAREELKSAEASMRFAVREVSGVDYFRDRRMQEKVPPHELVDQKTKDRLLHARAAVREIESRLAEYEEPETSPGPEAA